MFTSEGKQRRLASQGDSERTGHLESSPRGFTPLLQSARQGSLGVRCSQQLPREKSDRVEGPVLSLSETPSLTSQPDPVLSIFMRKYQGHGQEA